MSQRVKTVTAVFKMLNDFVKSDFSIFGRLLKGVYSARAWLESIARPVPIEDFFFFKSAFCVWASACVWSGETLENST